MMNPNPDGKEIILTEQANTKSIQHLRPQKWIQFLRNNTDPSIQLSQFINILFVEISAQKFYGYLTHR